MSDIKMTKKQMTLRKNAVAMQIKNIRQDYSGVLREDLPQDVIDEVCVLMEEMHQLRSALGKE